MSSCIPDGVESYFKEIGLEVLPWPENYSDFNQVEGILHNVKTSVMRTATTNNNKLIKRLIRVWNRVF